MIVVGTATALQLALRGGAPPGVDPLAFLAVPLGDMVVFALLLIAALKLRRNKEAHKRLMLLAYSAILVAAVARFPGVLPLGPLWFFGLTFLPVLALGVSYDLVTRRRVHPAYLWGGTLLILSVPVRLAISSTPAWRWLANTLIL
jgi:asparagine N-glycosylation enzyme membrane subunit Stt3